MLLAVVFFLGWIVYDAFKQYGALAGLFVLVLVLGSLFLPYMFWIVAFGYLVYRLAYPPRQRGTDPNAWRREMKRYDRMRRQTHPHTDAGTNILVSEKDPHLEELIAAKDFAQANGCATLRLAKGS